MPGTQVGLPAALPWAPVTMAPATTTLPADACLTAAAALSWRLQTNKVVLSVEFVTPSTDQQALYEAVAAKVRDGEFQRDTAEAQYGLLSASVFLSTYTNKL